MSQTARMLDDTLDRLLKRRLADPAAYADPDLPKALNAEIAEAGLHLVLVAEEDGGLGGTLAEAAGVAWRCGWHAAPVEIVETLLLPILPAPSENEVKAEAPLPLSQVPSLSSRDPHEWTETAAAKGMLLCAAAMTGAMARALEIASEYASTREQFGRPLSKFQAIQHKLAEAASELAVTEAALAAALEAEDEGRGRALLRLSAKAQAGRAATIVAATAHQVLGAIGFTQEHELHRYTRRLWQWRDDWGRQVDCEEAIGRAACAAPGGVWSYVADEGRADA